MNPQIQEGNREKASRKPKWKNYDFTMFLSRIITSRYIAVKWLRRVYWLLPLSIVDSFRKHRRLFFKSPWMLGEINQLHFQKESFPAISRLFFSSSTESADNLTEVILHQQTPATRPSCFFVDKTFISNILNSGNLQGRAKISACSLGGRASMRRSLFLDWHPARKKQLHMNLPLTFCPAKNLLTREYGRSTIRAQ